MGSFGNMKMRKLSIICCIAIWFLLLSACSGKPPGDIGVKDGELTPCPQSPNCVSSMGSAESDKIPPLSYDTSRNEAMAEIVAIVKEMTNIDIIQQNDSYLWAECRSQFFGFVDDLEISLPENKGIIHFRSASRSGYYDFGVNRKRVELISIEFQQRQKNEDHTPKK